MDNEQGAEHAGERAQPADGVYHQPTAAEIDARRELERDDATPDEKAEALAVLGRAAYYDNRLDDAVGLLERALDLAVATPVRADVSLALAPAYSKTGRAEDALALLGFDGELLSAAQRAKLENQRGIIHAESGRLDAALAAFTTASELHRAAGDAAGESRSLVNVAAAASELGRLDHAEACYAEAWRLADATDQAFSRAIIEGNLGYVASRRGDFGAALEWYGRGRDSFAALGSVDLVVAVLETDHATTLLDLGLNRAACDAADYARSSSTAGGNRMLEVQALLLLGEAQLRLRRLAEARATLDAARAAAVDLGLEPHELRARYLIQRLRSLDDSIEVDLDDTLELAAGLRAAGWAREALRTLLHAAQCALDEGHTDAARTLLGADTLPDDDGVDAFDLARAAGLRALVAGDAEALAAAVRAGEDELARQRRLVGSAELDARLGHRVQELRDLALQQAIDADDPVAVVETVERSRTGAVRAVGEPGRIRELRSQLRDLRVGLQEAQLGGAPTEETEARIAALEDELATATASASAEPRFASSVGGADPTGPAAACLTYVAHRGRVRVVVSGAGAGSDALVDLGPLEPIQRAIRSHRAGLRRLAFGDERALATVEATAARLSEVLVAAASIPAETPLAVVPDPALAGLAWSGLSDLFGRDHVVARSLRAASAPANALVVSSAGLLSAGELPTAGAELDALAAAWQPLAVQHRSEADLATAHDLFASCDLVHVAAHGTFLAENPFVSAIHFADGDLRLVDLETMRRVPRVVTLAACESGAAAEVGGDVVGSAEAFVQLGVEAVVASTTIVEDAAASRFVCDVHAHLAAGSPPVEALRRARALAVERGGPADHAAAASFVLHGTSACLLPLVTAC